MRIVLALSPISRVCVLSCDSVIVGLSVVLCSLGVLSGLSVVLCGLGVCSRSPQVVQATSRAGHKLCGLEVMQMKVAQAEKIFPIPFLRGTRV